MAPTFADNLASLASVKVIVESKTRVNPITDVSCFFSEILSSHTDPFAVQERWPPSCYVGEHYALWL